MNAVLRVIGVALSDARSDWRVFLAVVIQVASVTAPLLLFIAVRAGYIENLRLSFEANPDARLIRHEGQLRLSQDWFDDMGARPDVAFIAPKTRHLNVALRLRNPADRQIAPVEAELTPTLPGDPLTPRSTDHRVAGAVVALSDSLARALDVEAGDPVETLITRTVGERREARRETLTVVVILPAASHTRNVVFADPALMLAVERYREGATFEIAPLRPDETVASFRLYARDLDAVKPLALKLERDGMVVRTQARLIAEAETNSRALTAVVAVLSAILIIGGLLSISSAIGGGVLHRTRDLSVLRMLGYTSRQLLAFPLTQAVASTLAGAGVGLCVYAGAERVIAGRLADTLPIDGAALHLTGGMIAATLAFAALTGVIAAALVSRHVLNVDPTMRLRDG